MEIITHDKVCGMQVSHKKYTTEYRGKMHLFCSASCLTKFQAGPWSYTHPVARAYRTLRARIRKQFAPAKTKAKSGTQPIYSCPMHPEIIAHEPSACPECGMALEAVLSTTPGGYKEVEAAEERAYTVLLIRLIIAAVLSIPIMLAEMSPWNAPTFLSLILTTIVLFGAGSFIWQRAATAMRRGKMNMFTLIAMGSLTAYLYSAGITFLIRWQPELIPNAVRPAGGGHPYAYYETATVIVSLVILGQLLEEAGRRRVGKKLKALIHALPEQARRLTETLSPKVLARQDVPTELATETITAHEVQTGDILLVLPNDAIPIDAVVIAGESGVDEALLTGESLPVTKQRNDPLLGGSINGDGKLLIRATKVKGQTLLETIVNLTGKTLRERLPIQELNDRITTFFIPAVLALAVVSFFAWAAAGDVETGIIAAISVLIVACPCALGLAVPMALTASMSRGVRSGILIRRAGLVEQMHKVSLVAFDKTGTLTEGKPVLVQITPHSHSLKEHAALQLAFSIETLSTHPLAHAFRDAADKQSINSQPVEAFQSITGAGLSGRINGVRYRLGSAAFISQWGHSIPQYDSSDTTSPQVKGAVSKLFLASESHFLATFVVADTLRPSARSTVRALQKSGHEVVLLSGDEKSTCDVVGRELGLKRIYGKLLPEDKIKWVQQFKNDGHTVLMAGDGINDGPALAAADVSVVMGSKSPLALQAADAAIMTGQLSGISELFSLASDTVRNIRINLILAFAYNAISLPVAAGVLVIFGGPALSPMLAGLMMILSSLSIIGNALRVEFLNRT